MIGQELEAELGLVRRWKLCCDWLRGGSCAVIGQHVSYWQGRDLHSGQHHQGGPHPGRGGVPQVTQDMLSKMFSLLSYCQCFTLSQIILLVSGMTSGNAVRLMTCLNPPIYFHKLVKK